MSPSPVPGLTPGKILETALLIRPYVRTTPVVSADGTDFAPGLPRLTFKLESLQHAGSFKTRGAFTNLLSRQVPAAGVVAASGGNHGAAVAYAAQRLGVKATLFVPRISSEVKVARIRGYGAQLVIEGERYDDALAESLRFAQSSGAMNVHAFDQVETLLGQGTLGSELAWQAPELDTVLVAVGGGGLAAGMATWYGDRIRLIGVEPESAPTLTRALEAGRPVDAQAGGIAADSLAPRRVGELVFPMLKAHMKQVVLVTDEAIRSAQNRLWEVLRVVAEPGAAAATAALLSGRYKPAPGERVGVVVSGGNTSAVVFER